MTRSLASWMVAEQDPQKTQESADPVVPSICLAARRMVVLCSTIQPGHIHSSACKNRICNEAIRAGLHDIGMHESLGMTSCLFSGQDQPQNVHCRGLLYFRSQPASPSMTSRMWMDAGSSQFRIQPLQQAALNRQTEYKVIPCYCRAGT